MEYDQYQEDEHLIPTSPAWAVLLKVVLRCVWLAPKVDGFDDDVSGHKNDNEEIEENFVACSFEEWANILKVMYYLHLLIFFLCNLNTNGHFDHLQGSVSSQSGWSSV